MCSSDLGAKGSHLANKKTKKWVQQKSKGITVVCPGSGAPDCPVCHRTVSGAPGTSSQTLHLRENPEALRYNSPDCPVYTGQCPVLQERAPLATSIYGARAMAGVIVVTTKKGKAGTNRINYTGEFTMRLKPSPLYF